MRLWVTVVSDIRCNINCLLYCNCLHVKIGSVNIKQKERYLSKTFGIPIQTTHLAYQNTPLLIIAKENFCYAKGITCYCKMYHLPFTLRGSFTFYNKIDKTFVIPKGTSYWLYQHRQVTCYNVIDSGNPSVSHIMVLKWWYINEILYLVPNT